MRARPQTIQPKPAEPEPKGGKARREISRAALWSAARPRAAFNTRDLRNCRALAKTAREQSGAGTEEAEGNRGGWWPGEPHRTPKRCAQNIVENGVVVWERDTGDGREVNRS